MRRLLHSSSISINKQGHLCTKRKRKRKRKRKKERKKEKLVSINRTKRESLASISHQRQVNDRLSSICNNTGSNLDAGAKHTHVQNPLANKPTEKFKTLQPPCLQEHDPFVQRIQMETNLLSLCIHPPPTHCLSPVEQRI